MVSPCILNPDLRARGITRDQDREWFTRARERCQRYGIDVVPLPCPETLYLGSDREPGMFLDRLDTQEFSDLLDSLECEVRKIISERGFPICIVGVNSSPTCGVDATWYGPPGSPGAKKPGRGVFLDRFSDLPAVDVAVFSRYRLYLAAPLFSKAERNYNRHLAERLRNNFFEVYLPQDAGDDSHTRDGTAHRKIFDQHLAALEATDLMVAVIDGADADSGTAWEMGYAFAKGLPVISIRTDFRMAGHHEHVNLMLEQSSAVVHSEEELLSRLFFPAYQVRHINADIGGSQIG
ncbi:MAG: nucleoside 2-deoxyribosyltransferase [Methanoregulaceae archaeon]|nr:nucleoside 2-deoxyribosyltransferase [Methanoregulaceae archaeon]